MGEEGGFGGGEEGVRRLVKWFEGEVLRERRGLVLFVF